MRRENWLEWKSENIKIEEEYVNPDCPEMELLDAYQEGKCAICGKDCSKSGSRLVMDHCHESGLIRGLLCDGCNTSEGKSNYPVYRAYRKVYPTKILGLKMIYAHWASGNPPVAGFLEHKLDVYLWTPEECFDVMDLFAEVNAPINLDWLSKNEMAHVIRSAIKHASETGSKFYERSEELSVTDFLQRQAGCDLDTVGL